MRRLITSCRSIRKSHKLYASNINLVRERNQKTATTFPNKTASCFICIDLCESVVAFGKAGRKKRLRKTCEIFYESFKGRKESSVLGDGGGVGHAERLRRKKAEAQQSLAKIFVLIICLIWLNVFKCNFVSFYASRGLPEMKNFPHLTRASLSGFWLSHAFALPPNISF